MPERAQELMEAEEREHARIACADILGAGQALLDESEEAGARLALALPVGNGQVAQPTQHQQCDEDKGPDRSANPHVFAQQNHHHPDQQ